MQFYYTTDFQSPTHMPYIGKGLYLGTAALVESQQ